MATATTPSVFPGSQISHRHLFPGRPAAGPRAAPRLGRQAGLRAGEGGHRRAARERLGAARGLRRQGARRQDRHLGHHRPASQARPGEEVSGHRIHLRRTARVVRAQDIQHALALAVRSPTWVSSWCRSTAWGPPTAPRRSTTFAGTTSRTPASRIASSGIRPSPGSIPGTTSAASASTARRRAARIPRAPCFSTAISTRPPSRPAAATTTAWTRPRGTSSGWATQWVRNTRPTRTSTTPANSAASSCSLSANWTTTCRPNRRCAWPMPSSRRARTSICSWCRAWTTPTAVCTVTAVCRISSCAICTDWTRRTEMPGRRA